MYKRIVEEQGQPGSFKAQVCTQFYNESMLALAAYCFFENKPEPYLYIRIIHYNFLNISYPELT